MDSVLEYTLDNYMNYITESNIILNNYQVEASGKDTKKTLEDTNTSAIKLVISKLIDVCNRLRAKIGEFLDKFFKSGVTKKTADKVNSNPSIKNKIVDIFNIEKINSEYMKALAAVEASFTKGETNKLDAISEILQNNTKRITTGVTIASGLAISLKMSGISDSIMNALGAEERRLKKLAAAEGKDRNAVEKEMKCSRKKVEILEKQLKDNTDYHGMTLQAAMRLLRGKGTDQDKARAANWAADKIDKGGVTGKIVHNKIADAAADKASILGSGASSAARNAVKSNKGATTASLRAGATALQVKDMNNKTKALKGEFDKNK